MSLRSQSLRIARAVSKELHPTAHRCVASSALRDPQRPLIANYHSLSSSNDSLAANYFRNFSTKPEEAQEPASPEGETPPPIDDNGATDATKEAATEAAADTKEGGGEAKNDVADLENQIKELKDNLLRSLAEQENTRRIAQRDVANAKNFAISSFAKSLLDTSDNLTRALDSVPEEVRHDHDNHNVLANLYEGVKMTDDGLAKAFAKNGLVKYGDRGDKFDPNIHEALFEYPDPDGEAPGNVGQVMKVGFMLNKRVLRPAEVGVVKAP